ncbi:MAG TPA: KOW domain-containing RNA-binding protein [Clostridia bacterium]|nr:KOW domain-containing RNA-binding protein [Clostridia bacterium]
MEKPLEIGSVVLSRAGRDKGRFFLVVEIVSDQFVRIADGDMRRLETTKLKKIKHLKATGNIIENIAEKLKKSAKVYDAEIYSALRKL